MQHLANLLWDPFLCLLYLVTGVVLLLLTGAVAFRRGWSVFRTTLRAKSVSERGAATIGHREAFVSALAASVGVGNLAGVATALHLGGPGALFWIWVSALLGMSMRMCSTYLAIKCGPKDSTSPAFATPMSYLEAPGGRSAGRLPQIVAGLLLATGLINANLIQANSVSHALRHALGVPPLAVAVVLSVTVAIVSMGGVRTVVSACNRLAPGMLAAYVLIGLSVLLGHPGRTYQSFSLVFSFAFTPYAAGAGATGYVVLRSLQYGVSRGIFSHGSGIGMAPFFQSSNRDHPARGAFMSAMVPAVDTLIVCTITGLVILGHGYWMMSTSAYLTVSAFAAGAGELGKWVVLACLGVFAFTTVTAWAHFGERCYAYLGGTNVLAFRAVFCLVSFVGPLSPVALVWSLGDLLIGSLLLFHLLPLLQITIEHLPELRADLMAELPPQPQEAVVGTTDRPRGTGMDGVPMGAGSDSS